LPSEPSSVTAIKDYTNRYFFSVVVEMQPVQVHTKNQSIGIDLGIKPFAVMSDGSKAESPNYSKHVRKMHKLQKTVVGQQQGSNRGNNTQIQIPKQHNRMVDIRDGWEPGSQICSTWGFKWGKLNLKVWSVRCLNCGTEQDREENAAKNIESSCHRALGDSKRTQRQSKTTSVASVSEASRITVASAR
jgi:putative transposase